MSKPINLRQARKRKARADKARQAETNRVAHGAPKALRDLAEARRAQLARAVDGHRLERADAAQPTGPDSGLDSGPDSGPDIRPDAGPSAGSDGDV